MGAASGDRSGDPLTQYVELMSSFTNSLLGGVAGRGNGAPTDTSRPAGVTADPLVVESAPPGGRSRGELWIHNRSGAPVASVAAHSADLRRHDGWSIPGTSVRFEPVVIDELPDLTSRGIHVTVDVPEDAPPGVYRGLVSASNLPDVWLVLELEVLPSGTAS